MPEVAITIGGKSFTVACQAGEEQFLRGAAELLDREASALVDQIGRLPEARMLLMAGLMLADRTAAFEERALAAERSLAEQTSLIDEMRALPQPEPQRVDVAVIPASLAEALAALAEEAETVADRVEDRLSR